MSRETKAQKAARAEVREWLLGILEPGSTVYGIVRHVSRSGMRRVISFKAYPIGAEDGGLRDISSAIGEACGYSWNDRHYGLNVDGCGMDMIFSVVYNLGRVLYPDGIGCGGQVCRSNDHSNGDRDYSGKTIHKDGGFAFKSASL